MGGKHARTKGHSFERKIASELRVVFPNARRHLEYHSRDANGVDIQETGDYRFQCKKLKKYSSITAIEEIQCHRELEEVPVLVTAGDGLEPMAVLPFRELLRLLGLEAVALGTGVGEPCAKQSRSMSSYRTKA